MPFAAHFAFFFLIYLSFAFLCFVFLFFRSVEDMKKELVTGDKQPNRKHEINIKHDSIEITSAVNEHNIIQQSATPIISSTFIFFFSLSYILIKKPHNLFARNLFVARTLRACQVFYTGNLLLFCVYAFGSGCWMKSILNKSISYSFSL